MVASMLLSAAKYLSLPSVISYLKACDGSNKVIIDYYYQANIAA